MTIVIESVLESPVFFPGDTLFCRVYVSNKSQLQQQLQETSKEHSISWISAQIYGNLVVEPKYFKLPTNPSSPKPSMKFRSTSSSSTISNQKRVALGVGISSATSLPNMTDTGENGRSIFASPTTIIASDLNIPVNQTRSFIYYVTLPSILPPSFKGTSIRYCYFLSIAAQLFTHPAQILTIPIRILTPASALRQLKFKMNMTNQHDYEEGSTETPQETSKGLESISKWPISPYKKSQYFPVPYPQNLSQYDSNNTRKSVIDLLNKFSIPVSINISKGTEKLVTFSISKTAFKLGDSVCGTFDFSIATIPCYKVLVKLECEETIDPKYQQESKIKPNRRLYGELHEYTTNIRQTHFMFHIPVEASQEFQTKHVSVRWILRFEFTTPIKNPFNIQPTTTNGGGTLQPPPMISRSNSMVMSSPSKSPQPNNNNNTNGNISKSTSYNDDIAKQHGQQNSSSSTPPHHSMNRIIAEAPSDSESNLSSDNSLNEETVSNTSSNSKPQASINHSTSSSKQVGRKSEVPMVGVLNSMVDDGAQLVDTLHWSLPIRVLVSESPHELLHINKNELIL